MINHVQLFGPVTSLSWSKTGYLQLSVICGKTALLDSYIQQKWHNRTSRMNG